MKRFALRALRTVALKFTFFTAGILLSPATPNPFTVSYVKIDRETNTFINLQEDILVYVQIVVNRTISSSFSTNVFPQPLSITFGLV